MKSQALNEGRLTSFFSTLSEELTCSLGAYGPSRDRLVQRMRKRAGFVNQSLELGAFEKFLTVNKTLKGFSHALPDDVVANARHFITVMLERVTTRYSDTNIQNTLDYQMLYSRWRFGPGASNGVKGTHAASKIEQAMTCTSLCEPYVRRLRGSNAYFSAFDSMNPGVTLIYGSKLTSVPKNEETVRTIAIEPSGNMAMQLAAGSILEDTLSYIGCDITRQQPKNKALAQRGSIDGSIATVDLSAASDMITPSLVCALLPPKWSELLMNIRSPVISVKGDLVELNMISTMGNGYTFPLMTLCLCSLIYAYRCRHRGSPSLYIDWSSTAVFGDDIIVPVEEYTELCEILDQAGLVVNHSKSFYEGPFRESCGGDYMDGVDITPFYVKNLARDPDIYVALNQLLVWSAKNGFWPMRSFKLLRSMLHSGPFFVPEWYMPYQGIMTSQVPRKFKHFSLKQKSVRLKNEMFIMPLACGGYITGTDLGPIYTPRPRQPEYVTKSSRLPKGFLDGADLVSRPVTLSGRIAMIIAMAG